MGKFRITEDSEGFDVVIAPEHMQYNSNFITFDNFEDAQKRAVEVYEVRIDRLQREIDSLTFNKGKLIELKEENVRGLT